MKIERAAVIGGGQMGNGIVHVFALAGISVSLIDLDRGVIEKAMGAIESNMARQVKKGLSEEERHRALARISTSARIEDAAEAQLVVEAVPERLQLKQDVFSRLDSICPPETILASNTSSIPISKLAAATGRAGKVIGMHFMNPVPVMKLVEIIPADGTSVETIAAIRALTERLGKIPATSRDVPGFIANRILMPMINEACWALKEGVATKEDIDTTMKVGMNHPMGPLTLADFIGLDTCLSILQVLRAGLGGEKYEPCPLFDELVSAGRLGKKSGKGFYDYD